MNQVYTIGNTTYLAAWAGRASTVGYPERREGREPAPGSRGRDMHRRTPVGSYQAAVGLMGQKEAAEKWMQEKDRKKENAR